jgi:hypothetical protein
VQIRHLPIYVTCRQEVKDFLIMHRLIRNDKWMLRIPGQYSSVSNKRSRESKKFVFILDVGCGALNVRHNSKPYTTYLLQYVENSDLQTIRK